MVYNKHEWQDNELITADKLNNIEDSLLEQSRPSLPLRYMGMSMTYNENEESRLSQVISAYSGTVKQVSLTNMVSISGNTSSDPVSSTYQKIQTAIHNITDAGMKVIMLKPHIGPNRNDGFAKFKYIPDDINAFFTAYKNIILMQAGLCVDENIPILCVSNELDSLINETYKSYWVDIIDTLRNNYPSLLLTAAVAGAYGENQKVIYNLVDIIGINWYPEYYYGKINGVVDIPSNDVLSQMLLNYHANDSENPDAKKDIFYFSQLAETLNKPIYFTETGIMPTTDGLNQLLTTQTTTNFYEAQSAMLEAFWSTIAPSKNVVGINYWHAQEPFNITDLNNNITSVAELTWIKLQEEYLQ